MVVAGAVGVVAIPAVLALAAFKQIPAHRCEMMQKFVEWRVNEKLDEVKATDAQKQQVKAVEKDLFEQGRALHTGNRDFHNAVLAELQKDNPDPAQVHALVDARAASLKEFADKVADGVLKIHGILTPEQRAQIIKDIEEHHHAMRFEHE
jgi:Spy/CpxP family protein refolding chaperone